MCVAREGWLAAQSTPPLNLGYSTRGRRCLKWWSEAAFSCLGRTVKDVHWHFDFDLSYLLSPSHLEITVQIFANAAAGLRLLRFAWKRRLSTQFLHLRQLSVTITCKPWPVTHNLWPWTVNCKLRLLWFCIATLSDWLKKLAPLSQPITSKTKTNRDFARASFPALTVIASSFAWTMDCSASFGHLLLRPLVLVFWFVNTCAKNMYANGLTMRRAVCRGWLRFFGLVIGPFFLRKYQMATFFSCFP